VLPLKIDRREKITEESVQTRKSNTTENNSQEPQPDSDFRTILAFDINFVLLRQQSMSTFTCKYVGIIRMNL
jgi:hypothetical protein